LGMYRKSIKGILETLTGYKIMGVGSNIFVVADKNKIEDVWFSYDIQVKSILEKYKVNLVLDVGANRGQFVRALRNFYKGKVISFEPIPDIFNDLKKTAESDLQWDAYNLALGDRETTETFNVSELSLFSSFLKTNEYCAQRFGAHAKGAREEIVLVRRLDKVLEDLLPDLDNARIFLKMDTQGYDLEVFKGLGDKCKHVVALQTEVSVIPIYKEMFPWTESVNFFERAGYGIVGLFPVNKDSLRVIEYDCVMVSVGLENQSSDSRKRCPSG
jgi:FkbM family methyltransferase